MTTATQSRFVKNAHGRYDCLHAACPRKGDQGFKAPQAVGRHMQIAHGIAGTSPSALASQKGARKALAKRHQPEKASADLVAAFMPSRQKIDFPTGHAMRNEGACAEDHLNHCPRCAFDLATLKQALDPTLRSGALLKCPRCHLNLAAVQTALTPDMQALEPIRVQQVFQTIINIINRGT